MVFLSFVYLGIICFECELMLFNIIYRIADVKQHFKYFFRKSRKKFSLHLYIKAAHVPGVVLGLLWAALLVEIETGKK